MKKRFIRVYNNTSENNPGFDTPSPASRPGYSYPKKFLGIYDLMKISWKTLEERFSKITLIFIAVVMSFFVALTFLVAVASVWKNRTATFIIGFLAAAMLLFFGIIQNAAFFEVLNDENIKVRNAFRRSLSMFRVYLGCFFGYFLICANVLFLLTLLLTILVLSWEFLGGGQQKEFVAALNTTNWLGEILILFLFAPFFVWLCILQTFSFLAVAWGNMSAVKSIAYAYSLLRHNSKDVLWRTLVFSIFCFVALVVFVKFADKSFLSVVLIETTNFILGLWILVFVCTIYDNLCRIEGTEIGKHDLRSVKILIKTGALLLIPTFTLCFFAGDYVHQKLSTTETKSGVGIWMDIKKQMDADRTTDSDGDGLLDSEEKELGTDARKKDSDNDGLSDCDEVREYNTDPNKADTDGDGLSDYEEAIKWKTNALKSDTDGDGYVDGDEAKSGYDPLGAGKIKQQYIPSTDPESGSEENADSGEQTLNFE